MLTLKRKYQTWTATFSNGFLFNEEVSGSSEIAALRNLANAFRRNRKQVGVVKEMTEAIDRIAKAKFERKAVPQLYHNGVNLAEWKGNAT